MANLKNFPPRSSSAERSSSLSLSLSLSLSPAETAMAMPPNLFQPLYQPQQQQQQESSPFRNFYADGGQVSPLAAFYGPGAVRDRPQHPPYAPPFNVVGVAPGTLPAADGNDGGADLQFNFGLEPKRKKLEEQDLFENNNSQVSSIDFLQARSVSTGLGLSLDNSKMASSGDSALLSLLTDDVDRELQQQDAEIDRFLKFQILEFSVSQTCLFLPGAGTRSVWGHLKNHLGLS